MQKEEKTQENQDQIQQNQIQSIIPPYSITWTRISIISYIVPFVGHMGITDSQGTNHDFGGSYYVNQSKYQSIFGKPCKYYNLYDELTEEQKLKYDSVIEKVTRRYEKNYYSLFTQNCHNFVADVLNELGVKTRKGKQISVTNLVTNFLFRMKRM